MIRSRVSNGQIVPPRHAYCPLQDFETRAIDVARLVVARELLPLR